jgi:EmrB/QacA subfamily drug resistance transporter
MHNSDSPGERMKKRALGNDSANLLGFDAPEYLSAPGGGETGLQFPIISRSQRMFVTAGLMIGMFLSALEATAVSTAMPTVVSSLGGLNIYSWVFSAYILTSTISLPFWGRLSDLYGRKRFYIIGIAIFLVGSALSGQSKSMNALILFRGLQGIGGGALLTLGMIIVGEMFSLRERARVQGLFGGVWGLSSIVGPILGGFITDQFSWRWVFYLNIPFGIIAVAIIWFALKEKTDADKKVNLDIRGATVLTAVASIFLIGLTQIGKDDSLHSLVATLMLVSCIPLVWLFIKTQKLAKDPILPLELFSNPFFKTSVITGFLVGMAMFGSISFIPLFIQGVIGTNATQAGTILTPLLLSWVFFSSISGKLMLRFGYRPIIIIGTALLSIGFFLLSDMSKDTSRHGTIAVLLILGTGMGMIFIPLLLAVQNSVPRWRLGIATSATQFFRSMGATIGVSVMGMVLSTTMLYGTDSISKSFEASELHYLKSPDLIVNPGVRASLSPEIHNALTNILAGSLRNVFLTGLFIALVAFSSAFLMPKKRFIDMREGEKKSFS